MLRSTLFLVSMVLSATLYAQAFDEWKIIHAGTLLADAREDVLTEQSIIVRNNQIVEVLDGYVPPGQVSGTANATTITNTSSSERRRRWWW